MSVTPTQPAWTPVYVPWIYVSPSGRQWVYAHVQHERGEAWSVTVWRRQGRYRRAVSPTLADARTATDAMAAACAAAGLDGRRALLRAAPGLGHPAPLR